MAAAAAATAAQDAAALFSVSIYPFFFFFGDLPAARNRRDSKICLGTERGGVSEDSDEMKES